MSKRHICRPSTMQNMWKFDTVIEPFRITAVEEIPLLCRAERALALERAHNNLFGLQASEVTIDLLPDSGTGAMSSRQWGVLMQGDESYAGSRSFARLQATLQELTGYRHIFPVHQVRAAERILARTVLQPGQVVLNNTHFDTTRANFEQVGAHAIDLPAGASDFKGDMDLVALEAHLQRDPVALAMMTLTNNAVGGHPVSMANLRAVSRLCKQAGVPFFLDAARFAENAWFIHAREPGFGRHTLPDIAREIFDLADGCSISAKKDAMVHIGGVLAAQREDWAELFRREFMLGEGYVTYGGLARRDLETMSVGFQEALDPDYLRYRARSVAYFAKAWSRQACRRYSRPTDTPYLLTPASCSRTSRPNSFRARRWPSPSTWKEGFVASR